MVEKYIHAISVTIWHDQKTAITVHWFNCTIYISVFPDVVAWYRRTYTFFAPTVFRLVDSTESGFILKH